MVIDFDRVEGRSTEFVLKHVRASQDVFRKEIEAGGFKVVPSTKAPPLKETFFLRFREVVDIARGLSCQRGHDRGISWTKTN